MGLEAPPALAALTSLLSLLSRCPWIVPGRSCPDLGAASPLRPTPLCAVLPETARAPAGHTVPHPDEPYVVRPLWPAQGLLCPQLLLFLERGVARPGRQNGRALSGVIATMDMWQARGWGARA